MQALRHYPGELEQMQSLPLDVKIKMSERRITEWYNAYDGETYVSFSGGKDSTVLLHLVRRLYPDVPAVFVDTGLEYPEIREFVKTFENVIWVKPKMNFRRVITERGYPVASKEVARKVQYYRAGSEWAKKFFDGTAVDQQGRPSRYRVSNRWLKLVDAPFKVSSDCCDIMKKSPVRAYQKETGKFPFIGTLACESLIRKQAWMRTGCNAFDADHPKSTPMAFWTEQDVLEYLNTYKIPFCSLYGEIVRDEESGHLFTTGADRTGCMFCMFGCHLEPPPTDFRG